MPQFYERFTDRYGRQFAATKDADDTTTLVDNWDTFVSDHNTQDLLMKARSRRLITSIVLRLYKIRQT